MSEAEWMACTDPEAMRRHLANVVWFPNRTSQRKKRLFCVACCRRIGDLDEECRQQLEEAERMADCEVCPEEAQAAKAAYYGSARQQGCSWELRAVLAAKAAGWGGAGAAAVCATPSPAQREEEAQCHLLRDIFGNPFRPVAFDPAWLTPTVTGIAAAAYEERILPSGDLDPARLAVLADALKDAGCDNTEILTHCRQPGEHVRGCWIIDLLLGKG